MHQQPPRFLSRSVWQVETTQFGDPRSVRGGDTLEAPPIIGRDEFQLSDDEMTPVSDAIVEASFSSALPWQATTQVEDGSGIVIEAAQDGIYKFVGRWNVDSTMFGLASEFARVARIKAPEISDDVYLIKKREGEQGRAGKR